MADVVVGVLMGSDSDWPVMEETIKVLGEFEVPCEVQVASAHRTPGRVAEYASGARERGLKVIIAAAGLAAHLAGVVAAHTTLPVIGVPLDAALGGVDALLATVQMPPGVPVATVAVGRTGARNAALLAVQMLALADEALAEKLTRYKERMADQVTERNRRVQEQWRGQ